MSWYHPTTYAEIIASIENGMVFNSTRLGIKADHAHLVCGHYSTRGMLSGHLDDFAHRIITSNDELHARYVAGNRWSAERDDDVTYFVVRDGNALAYVTRVGELVVNPRVDTGLPRYRDALRRMLPALKIRATRAAGGQYRESV